MNLRKMQYVPKLYYYVNDEYIIWRGQKYTFKLIDAEAYEMINGDCRECCFDDYRDNSGNHICPSKDKNFNWSCSKYINDFQIILEKDE